jgi:hypothetical protein
MARNVTNWLGSIGSIEIGRETLEIFEMTVRQSAGMGGRKQDLRRVAGNEGFLPARRAQAPAVARLQPGKSKFGTRRGQVIAARLREHEELRGHDRAYCVRPAILRSGIAAAVAKEAGQGPGRAGRERAAQHVPRRLPFEAPRLFVAHVSHR